MGPRSRRIGYPGGMPVEIIPMKDGRLTCRVRGAQADLYMEARPDRPGLYRGALSGPAGRWDLGLLLPESGCLRLSRTLPVAALDRAGCWPVTKAEAVLTHPFPGGVELPVPLGWRRVPDPSVLFPGDPVLARAAGGTKGWLLCPGKDGGFSLAAPWEPGQPFPLLPVFCFAKICTMAGRRWAVFRFQCDGRPVIEGGEEPSSPCHTGQTHEKQITTN